MPRVVGGLRLAALFLLPLSLRAQQPDTFKDPDEESCVVSPFSRLTTMEGRFERDVKERSSTETMRIGDRFELTITQSGCTHYSLSFAFRWLKGVPKPAAAIREAAEILRTLKHKEGEGTTIAFLAELLRKTPVAKLGKVQEAGEFASANVAIEKGVLYLNYSFAA